MAIFKSRMIRNKVMEAVEKRIEQVELEYQDDIEEIERDAEMKKEKALEKHIHSIVSKLL